MAIHSQLAQLNFQAQTTASLSDLEKSQLHAFFELNYQQANHDYLDASLTKLDRIAMAFESDKLVGFSLAGSARRALPKIEGEQVMMLGGIGCIDSRFRRVGLFSHLAMLAGGEAKQVLSGVDRVLACARIAHPASFRTINSMPGCIPNLDKPLSEWHLAVANIAAELYGVSLKPQSLVVQGSGTPIGYPNIAVEASEEEWLPFAEVDRDAGDSLLAIAWAPSPPPGW